LPTEATAGSLERPYTPPALVELGSVDELTLGCDKTYGDSDGFTFQGQAIVCTSA
jgi:hypothetical protein